MNKKMKVEVISREIVKPSLPTPLHLRHYQLSFLDTVAPPVYIPIVFFYGKPENCANFGTGSGLFNHLKKSLSDVLTKYYPLAGRVEDNFTVLCNDAGAHLWEAKTSCQLSHIIKDPDSDVVNKFLPSGFEEEGKVALAAQVTTLGCGGVAIGIRISHKIADGRSSILFFNNWADAARGKDASGPLLESAALFPPKNLSGFEPRTGITDKNIVGKRFVFDASKIAALRAKYAEKLSSEDPQNPTRIEVLSAFIWSQFAKATDNHGDSWKEKRHAVVHTVNLRKRMDPPLPEASFGNIYQTAVTIPTVEYREHWHGLIRKIRDSLRKIDNDFVKKLQHGNEILKVLKTGAMEFNKPEVISFSFTSMCRFPIYEADFGWGKPEWVGRGKMPFKNLVIFLDSKCGKGIEAWVYLEDNDMAKFESSKELLELLSPVLSA